MHKNDFIFDSHDKKLFWLHPPGGTREKIRWLHPPLHWGKNLPATKKLSRGGFLPPTTIGGLLSRFKLKFQKSMFFLHIEEIDKKTL